jgi:hypothetical protein
MKSARFPRFVLSSTLFAFALLLVGCGGTSNLALTPGNWGVTMVSSNPATGTFYVGGNLTQSGTTVSGKLSASNSLCFSPSPALTFSGTVKNKQVTLTSAPDSGGQVITIVASGTTGSALSGTYSVAGGTCNSDHGTVTANTMPSISGTWSGSVAPDLPGDANPMLSIALTQASTASADGTFALTGNLTYTGSSCSASGTATGFLAGPYLSLSGTTVEQDGSPGSFTYNNVLLDSTTAPKNMKGDYDVTGGLCLGESTISPTFTKQ